jgi:hypothetical protein
LHHVSHLRISLIRRHNELNLQLVKDIHEKINHFLRQHQAFSEALFGFLKVLFALELQAHLTILIFLLDSFLFRRRLRFQMQSVKYTDCLNLLVFKKTEHLQGVA